MTLHRKAAFALAAALTALTIGAATAQTLTAPTYERAVPYGYGCYTGDACGQYDSYGRGN